jgi:hypothetical protein
MSWLTKHYIYSYRKKLAVQSQKNKMIQDLFFVKAVKNQHNNVISVNMVAYNPFT